MSTIKIDAFHVIGISIQTSNAEGQSGQDIPNLWTKFMSENVAASIPNKVSDEIYCIYTNYEGDHTKPYTTLLGCKVSGLAQIPEGLKGMTFNTANYQSFTAKGNLMEGVVWQKWSEIWSTEMDRTFIADFEVYGAKAQDPTNAEVEIFVGVK